MKDQGLLSINPHTLGGLAREDRERRGSLALAASFRARRARRGAAAVGER
jgi:hypothetical protein